MSVSLAMSVSVSVSVSASVSMPISVSVFLSVTYLGVCPPLSTFMYVSSCLILSLCLPYHKAP